MPEGMVYYDQQGTLKVIYYSEIITVTFTPTQLREIEYYSDAVDLLAEHGMLTDAEQESYTGYGHISGEHDCKSWLVDIPFLIIQFSFQPGLDGKPFSEAFLITTTHQKWRLRDSSKGIHTQLCQIYQERVEDNHPYPYNNINVPRGLSVNRYSYTRDDSKRIQAKTYSLNFGS